MVWFPSFAVNQTTVSKRLVLAARINEMFGSSAVFSGNTEMIFWNQCSMEVFLQHWRFSCKEKVWLDESIFRWKVANISPSTSWPSTQSSGLVSVFSRTAHSGILDHSNFHSVSGGIPNTHLRHSVNNLWTDAFLWGERSLSASFVITFLTQSSGETETEAEGGTKTFLLNRPAVAKIVIHQPTNRPACN